MTAADLPTILHLDLDAFFASAEQLDRPELRGRPVIVGGPANRGVVAAASYEARAFGVRSAMPSARARRACPEGVFVAPRMARYVELSQQVMAILGDITPLVEPLSLDEAFLDVAGATRRFGPGPAIGAMARERIRSEVGLTASVGVASTKMLAKIASDLAKPDGLLVVPLGDELAFLHPLPVERLWGVGPATLARLARYGVVTVGDLAALPESTVVGALGAAAGVHLHALAHNRDSRPVEPHREVKSIGHEETFAADRADPVGLAREVTRMADLVAARVRHAGKLARTVQLKLRFADFTTITRAHTLTTPTDLAARIGATARELLAAEDLRDGIRLLGVAVSQFVDPGAVTEQLSLDAFAEPGPGPGSRDEAADRALESAVDAVRARFGPESVGRAAAAADGRLRPGRRGSLWGPDDEEN